MLSQWLTQEYPSSADSLLEGLEEMFTINRLELCSLLGRCLGTRNIIASPYAGGPPEDETRDARAGSCPAAPPRSYLS